MVFSVTNASNNGLTTHAGVLEFSAPEGLVYVPPWMFRQLQLAVGGLVVVRDVRLEKGTYCKIQPQSVAFLDISDPRAVYHNYIQ
jgi:ubiquitin fusion degradation protein 1